MSAMERFNFEGHVVRVDVDEAGDPWWVLADVCDALGLTSPHKVAERVPEDERSIVPVIDSMGRAQDTAVVNEPGLYRVIFRSNKDEAKRMQYWVFHEVLPAIRKTGQYTHPAAQPKRTPVEVETRHPDGTIVIERYQVSDKPAGNPRPPRALPAPSVDLDRLRKAFHSALTRALGRCDWYQDMDRYQRGELRSRINADLKDTITKPRAEWTADDYETAISWLDIREGIDIKHIILEAN